MVILEWQRFAGMFEMMEDASLERFELDTAEVLAAYRLYGVDPADKLHEYVILEALQEYLARMPRHLQDESRGVVASQRLLDSLDYALIFVLQEAWLFMPPEVLSVRLKLENQMAAESHLSGLRWGDLRPCVKTRWDRYHSAIEDDPEQATEEAEIEAAGREARNQYSRAEQMLYTFISVYVLIRIATVVRNRLEAFGEEAVEDVIWFEVVVTDLLRSVVAAMPDDVRRLWRVTMPER